MPNKKGRTIILMMDSFGIGGAEDAAKFGDQGADTLGHIAAERGGLHGRCRLIDRTVNRLADIIGHSLCKKADGQGKD